MIGLLQKFDRWDDDGNGEIAEVLGRLDLEAFAKLKERIEVVLCCHGLRESKLLANCTLPLTGKHCVKRIVTDLAVLDVTENGFKLLEKAPGVTVEEIKLKTAGKLIIEGDIPDMVI